MSGPTQAQYITFIGTLANGRKAPEEYVVEVLAGEGAATVTGGWPEWLTLGRPQRIGMTVLQGYPPIKLTIPIRFEAVREDLEERKGKAYDIEREVQRLEWMGGRGRPLGTHPKPGGTFTGHPGHDALGDSPLIEVSTTNGSRQTATIPVQFQSLKYVIDGEAGGIVFDQNPLKNRNGARLRQLATVYLKQFVAAPGTSADSPSERANARAGGKGKGKTVRSTHALNTVNRIAIHYTKTTETAREILAANKGNKAIGVNPEKPLKVGTKIFLPYNATHHLGNG